MINFIYGDPGTGKTEAIFNKLAEDAKAKKNALVIVPEQMTVSMERDVLKRLSPSAQLYIEVVNFTRLANKLFREHGGITYNYATPAVQKLIMWQAVKSAAPFLSEYKISAGDNNALADAMLATYKELYASGISFEDLDKLSLSNPDTLLSRKLKDITTVLSIYSTLLYDRFSDELDELSRLSKLLNSKKCLCGTNVYIDGFSSLTGIEHRIIKSIFCQADNCYVTIGISDPTYRGIDTVSLKRFSDTLRRDCASLGLSSKTIKLVKNHRSISPALSHLSANLWKLDTIRNEDNAIQNDNSVELFRACDIYDECEYAAAKVKKLIESGYRYKDISIIARNIEKYRGIIDQSLESFSIPYFLSDKTDLSLSPLSRLVLSALKIANFGWRRGDVIAHLKTGLCGVTTRDSDIFEAYTAKWNISGKQFLSDSDWNMNPDGYTVTKTERGEMVLNIANTVKREFVSKLKTYISEIKNAVSYKELCIATVHYLDALNVQSSLREISLRYINAGKIREASEFTRIYDIFLDSLDAVCDALGEEAQPDLVSFSTAVKTVLENTELGSIPTSQDEVTLGSANMIRADNAKCIIILGACDGEFPANAQNSGLLTDSERDYLIKQDIKISGDRELRAADELYYFRRAAAAPSEKLIIFTRADSEPSIAFSRIQTIIPSLKIKETSDDLYTKFGSYNAISEYYPLFKGTDIGEAMHRLLSCSDSLANITDYESISAEHDVISPMIVKEAVGNELKMSQSKIEEYVRCKFSYSCKYFLKLDDGKKAEFAYNSIGTLVHAVLEKFLYTVFVRNKGQYPSDKEKEELLNSVIDCYITDLLPDQQEKRNARLIHLIGRLKTLSLLIIDDLLEEFSDSSFRPQFFELPIGTKDQPSINIMLKNGTKLTLNGIIDRVDVYRDGDDIYIRVVDYKTGDKTFSIADIEEGKNLQLLLYIFAITGNSESNLRFGGNVKPAGITYLSAVPSKVKANTFNDDINTRNAAITDIKRSGLIIDDEKILNAVSRSSQSRYLMSSARKRSTVTEKEFNSLFDQVASVLTEIGNEIISGNANAIPKEDSDACKYCNYATICRASKKKKP
jgi:ATP-dependent helicase/nuclease subunit B